MSNMSFSTREDKHLEQGVNNICTFMQFQKDDHQAMARALEHGEHERAINYQICGRSAYKFIALNQKRLGFNSE